ncbi:MAG TPA: serine hydrolase domain-containing protein [Woeseiaceae bacterium]|nr:serine hydrolase domain-containing protein [Woeseiaceae bacterium]
MKRQHDLPLVLLMVLLGSCGQPPAEDTQQADAIDDLFSAYQKGVQPGVAVAVVQDGKLVLQRSYGYADIDAQTPITADTAFDLASVSKQFGAMAIMLLEEDGKLSYDDPIGKYVSELKVYDGVTIRHLLTHTGGLPDYYDVIDTTSAMPTNQDAAELLGQMAKADFAPGERYEYSNSGYDMLGPIVESASGMRFADFVRERIFIPSGMMSSYVHDDRLPGIPNGARAYAPSGDGFAPDYDNPLNAIVGSGSIFSSLNDLVRWDEVLYTDKLVSAETLELAFTSGTTNSGEPLDYGFGWRIDEYAGHKRLRHGGSWVGFRSHIARIPERRFSVILLSNRADFEPEDYVDTITGLYLGPGEE